MPTGPPCPPLTHDWKKTVSDPASLLNRGTAVHRVTQDWGNGILTQCERDNSAIPSEPSHESKEIGGAVIRNACSRRLTRRALLGDAVTIAATLLLNACGGTHPGTAMNAPTKTPGNGGFLYHPNVPSDEIPLLLDEWHAIGLDIIIVSEIREKTGGCDGAAGAAYQWLEGMPENLGIILDAAGQRGMKVYVGLTSSSGTCPFFYREPNVTQDANDVASTVGAVLASYGDRGALSGWSMTNEPALAYEQNPVNLDAIIGYYAALHTAIRAHSPLPIVVSPYLANYAGQGPQTPTGVAGNSALFERGAGGDITQVWQDSTGADAISVGWPRSDRMVFTVGDMYKAIATTLGTQKFWADNEIYTYPASGSGYRPGPIVRIARQLSLSRDAAERILWLPASHMSAIAGSRYPEAARLLAAYKAWFGKPGGGEYVSPVGYTYTVGRPLESHNDNNKKLFDLWTGDPRNSDEQHWVGFAPGAIEIRIDMGSTKTLNWAGVHCLNLNAQGISLPDTLSLSASIDDILYMPQGTWTNHLTKDDCEYVFANSQAISVPCRYVKLRLTNAQKTWLSEIEMVANAF